mgnify:CR=1 FL=1|tara:strand:+ start:1650 stop:2411 length:762 start_codon:yes stop_codon:yes gene_type:complete
MKIILQILLTLCFTYSIIAKEAGETEITTDDGIEVFQNEKYYLLKKNVNIVSDNFNLRADNVKINFDKSLYDIIELNAKGNVSFESNELSIRGSGESLRFEVLIENIKVEGIKSNLKTEDVEMFSDGFIEVNNLTGSFLLNGMNSKLINKNIVIEGESIDGIFSKNTINKEISFLDVFDKKISYVKNNDTEMYAKKIKFNNDDSIIELIDNVTIIRNGENITGDYGTLDTKKNSYKIKSNNKTKVKVIIQNDE